jgi:hypothetical protein
VPLVAGRVQVAPDRLLVAEGPPAARAVADLVSVSPGGLELAIVDDCVMPRDGAVAECEQRGVLRASGEVLRFRHEIARLALSEALGSQQVRNLNAQVFAALRKRTASGDHLARLAHHAEAAGDTVAAHEYSVAAARRAADLAAHRQAAEHYARAIRFSSHIGDRPRAALRDAYAWGGRRTGRGLAVLYRHAMTRSGLTAARTTVFLCLVAGAPPATGQAQAQALPAHAPGARVLLDAPNCYPDGARFRDRIDRALATGLPVAIEQDLVWFRDPRSGVHRSIVSHGEPFTGTEPRFSA